LNPSLKVFIELGFQRSKKQSLIVGIILVLFSIFMISLFWLDSNLKNSTTLIKIAFSILIAVFGGFGFTFFYVAFFKISKQKNNLLNILEHNKNEVQKIHYYMVYSKLVDKNNPNPTGSQHYIQVTFLNGNILQLSFPYERISEVLELFYTQVPHARQ